MSDTLPPLPEAQNDNRSSGRAGFHAPYGPAYTADQMRSYAAAALAAAVAEPAAWIDRWGNLALHTLRDTAGATPLYTRPAAVAEPVAHLWQHSETGRTRVVMPDQVVTADASWHVVGPLYLAAPPQREREPLTDAESRAAFEAFAQDCPMGGFSIDPDTRPGRGGQYWSSHTQIMWGTWQAAIAHARAHGIAPASAPKEQ